MVGVETMVSRQWGISWQITPRVLTDAMVKGGDVARRAFQAMIADEED